MYVYFPFKISDSVGEYEDVQSQKTVELQRLEQNPA